MIYINTRKEHNSRDDDSEIKWNPRVLGYFLHYEDWIGQGTTLANEVKFLWNFSRSSIDHSTLDRGQQATTGPRQPFSVIIVNIILQYSALVHVSTQPCFYIIYISNALLLLLLLFIIVVVNNYY